MSWFIPGLGMFCEAYFIFSVGNIKQFFPYEYPDCWKTYKTCTVNLTRAPDYMQIVGIIFGMITLGYLGDKIGREPTCSNTLSPHLGQPQALTCCPRAGKWGSVFTASVMFVGCILLTLTGIGLDGRQMAIWYIISQVNPCLSALFPCLCLALLPSSLTRCMAVLRWRCVLVSHAKAMHPAEHWTWEDLGQPQHLSALRDGRMR